MQRVRGNRSRNDAVALPALEIAQIESLGPGMIRARFMRSWQVGQYGRSTGNNEGPVEWD